jgi:hypothetical protein
MKLEKILDKLGSLEKNSFIKIIDNIISKNPKNYKDIDLILSSTDKVLKTVDSQNVAKIFKLVKTEFLDYIKTEFEDTSSQLDILIDIIIRDGRCIMSQVHLSNLYDVEIKKLKSSIKILNSDLENEKSDMTLERKRDYRIYKSCLFTAYNNDLVNNREARISSDELSILLALSKELDLSQEEIKLINYSILPIKNIQITEVINNLKNFGVVFYSKKDSTIYVADEMVSLLRELRGKEIADKYFRRVLTLLREPVVNQIAKKHSIDRKLTNSEKIEKIIKEGISFTGVLLTDVYKDGASLTEKKKELNDLCEIGLNIENLKGNTLEDKIKSLINHFETIDKDDKIGISLDGYEKMVAQLNLTLPNFNKQVKLQFELQADFVLNAKLLLDYNIKPRDILDLIGKNELTLFIKGNGIKQRGDNIANVLEFYKDTENIYLENYENVAFRNLNILKENGIIIKESELGLKFEDLTRIIFNKIGFNVDEKLKNTLNTTKDKIDVLLNLGNDEIIIVECKTSKESSYNKFSAVSRQLKSYQSLALKNNLRVIKVLLIAPDFSEDFVSDCEMDTELNLSLITASTLSKIVGVFKLSKHKIFPHILFRDVIINEERILKALIK